VWRLVESPGPHTSNPPGLFPFRPQDRPRRTIADAGRRGLVVKPPGVLSSPNPPHQGAFLFSECLSREHIEIDVLRDLLLEAAVRPLAGEWHGNDRRIMMA
jgi:hypothetical protein